MFYQIGTCPNNTTRSICICIGGIGSDQYFKPCTKHYKVLSISSKLMYKFSINSEA